MSIWLFSLILLYSTICVVPFEEEIKSTTKTEEYSNEIPLSILKPYIIEIDQIASRTNLEEVIHEIYDQTSNDFQTFVECAKAHMYTPAEPFQNCSDKIYSTHLALDITATQFRAIGDKQYDDNQTDLIKELSAYSFDIGIEKLQKTITDLKHSTSNLNQKLKQLLKLGTHLYSNFNDAYVELKERIEKTRAEINKTKSKLEDDMRTINKLITKTKNTRIIFQKESAMIELLFDLAAAYDDFLKGHDIKLSHNLYQRLDEIRERIRKELKPFLTILFESIVSDLSEISASKFIEIQNLTSKNNPLL